MQTRFGRDPTPILTKNVASFIRLGDWAEGMLYDHAAVGATLTYAPTDATLVYDEMYPVCSPALTSTIATVDSTGTVITIAFSNNIKVPQAPQNQISMSLCNLTLTTSVLELLGTNYACEISGANFIIYAGDNSTFAAGNQLHLRQSVIYTQDCMFPLMGRNVPVTENSNDDESTYYISPIVPSYIIIPTITISAPALSSICDDLVITVSNYTGRGKRMLSGMSLSCDSAVGWGSDTGHKEAVQAVNSYVSSLILPAPFSSVTIPTGVLTANLTYTFTASITNYQSQVATDSIAVVISPADSPRFTLEGVSAELRRYRNNSVTATVLATSCNGTFLAKGCEDFVITFAQITPAVDEIPASKMLSEGCATLLIPAGTLLWDTDYNFVVKAVARVTSTYYPSKGFTLRASRTKVRTREGLTERK